MANPKRKLNTNTQGDFFVDDTCINCDACRIIAPNNFLENGEFSSVHKQPENEQEIQESMQALISCPTGSIGYQGEIKIKDFMDSLPKEIEARIYFNGYTSRKSFGARSYLVIHPDGNWLIDSPKFVPALVKAFKELGGIKYIFLSHRDDVADADKYAQEFGAQRIIHKDELEAQPEAEIIIESNDDVDFSPDFKIITTPGHTKGQMVLLYKNKYLFSGDHIWWSTGLKAIGVMQDYCWYSWDKWLESIEKLLKYRFEWIMPGHGRICKREPEQMHTEIKAFLKSTKSI